MSSEEQEHEILRRCVRLAVLAHARGLTKQSFKDNRL